MHTAPSLGTRLNPSRNGSRRTQTAMHAAPSLLKPNPAVDERTLSTWGCFKISLLRDSLGRNLGVAAERDTCARVSGVLVWKMCVRVLLLVVPPDEIGDTESAVDAARVRVGPPPECVDGAGP